jgi:hypothetical protein
MDVSMAIFLAIVNASSRLRLAVPSRLRTGSRFARFASHNIAALHKMKSAQRLRNRVWLWRIGHAGLAQLVAALPGSYRARDC